MTSRMDCSKRCLW